jgi:Ca-activated chloride channel homolog
MQARTRSRRITTAVGLMAALILTGCSAGGGAPDNAFPAPPPQGPILGQGLETPAGGEIDPRREPKSTFAIDIDTASYNFARRQILDGRRPDPEFIRPEEFINAFRQDFPQPSGDGFTVSVDGARLPQTQETDGEARLLRVGLQTRAEDRSTRQDAALTFVIDVSGSMSEPGRLDLVQDALHTLVDQLRDTDSVAIVEYESKAHVVREMTPVRSRSVLHKAIDELRTGGSTNLEDGLVVGYRVARDGFVNGATNRVVLLSDGLANTGDTSASPILTRIREEAGKQIALLGVGVGSEYGDELMERLADEGDGFVTYVSEREQARRLFVDQLPATLAVRARDAKVQVTFDPSTVVSYRLVGYEDRTLAAKDFRNDRVDGGEVGPGHSVTALYLVYLNRGTSGPVAEARVRWQSPEGDEAREKAATVKVSDLDGAFTAASPRLRMCYAAAYFAESLRHSRYAAQVRRSDLAAVADDVYRATEDAQVHELAQLIRQSG